METINFNPAQMPAGQTANYNPLPLRKEESLKIFAILFFRRDVPLDIINDHKLSLSLSAAYSGGDAIMSAHQALKDMGLNPDNYKIPVMMINIEADKIIQSDAKPIALSNPKPEIELPKEKKAEKSIEEMTSFISYVFEKVGTDEEIKIAKKVIKKFKAHAVKQKQPN